MDEDKTVFEMNNLTRTDTSVPEAGSDNHVGIDKSDGTWKGVARPAFIKGFLSGQQQDSIKSADHIVEVEKSLTRKVGINEDIKIGNNRTRQVGGNETVSVKQNRKAAVSLNEEVTIDGLRMVSVGRSQVIKVGTKHSISAGTEIEVSAPKITLTATQEITIQCGAGRININAAGIITIEGPMVKVNC